MNEVLIIGAAGFVGSYLIDYIQEKCNWSIAATKMPYEKLNRENIEMYDLDILDKRAVRQLLEDVHPDYIFHLAAQSSVADSWQNPELTVDVNIKGTINVMDALRTLDYKPHLLLIGSGEEYGHVKSDEVPIMEENAVRPGNIYAVTKACQNMLGKIYVDAYGLNIVSVRAFNHIGPNQAPIFVVADFCKQVAEIERGEKEAVIHVGNLSAKRDFTDVRDIVRGYVELVKLGNSGETYNIGSGHAVEIQYILDKILSLSQKKIEVKVEPAKLRPIDVPVIEADISKMQKCTRWRPEIELEQTLRETLDYWRNKSVF